MNKTNPDHLIERLESIKDSRLKIGVVLSALNEDGSRDGPFSDCIIIDRQMHGCKEGYENITVSRPHATAIEKYWSAPAEVFTQFETLDLYESSISRYGINLTGVSGNPDRRLNYISDNSCVDIFAIYCKDCNRQSVITSQDHREYFPNGDYSKTPNRCPHCLETNTDVIQTNLKSRV
jgi:hypothetical protein